MRRNDNPGRGSRWLWRCLILVCFLFTVTLIHPADVQAASRDSLKKKLASTTSDKICGFYYRDLDGDGDREAVGLTSNEALGEGAFRGVRLWYVSDEKCTCFYSEGSLSYYPELWKVKNTYLFRIDKLATGSTTSCNIWRFTKDGPQKLDLSLDNLERIKGNQFRFVHSTFDAFYQDFDLGHSWKPYYLYWNGKEFVEYGGIKITESQLKKAVGASKVLQDIKKQGWKITDIYYRANGIININCQKGDDTFHTNDNVTLKLKGRRVYYDTTISPDEKTRFEKAAYIGIYGKSSTQVNKVTYPKKFPLS